MKIAQPAAHTKSEKQAAEQHQNPIAAIADSRPSAFTMQRFQDLGNSSPRVRQLKRQAELMRVGSPMTGINFHRWPYNSSQPTPPKPQDDATTNAPAGPVQRNRKPNNTGLNDQLKSGIESLSGISMDHVKVHYNSAKPAQLHALAFAQGSEIYLAPGQERHLAHEAWHIVQQAQGRVHPTVQKHDQTKINDDIGLEREADEMGAHTERFRNPSSMTPLEASEIATAARNRGTESVYQLVPQEIDVEAGGNYAKAVANTDFALSIGIFRSIDWAAEAEAAGDTIEILREDNLGQTEALKLELQAETETKQKKDLEKRIKKLKNSSTEINNTENELNKLILSGNIKVKEFDNGSGVQSQLSEDLFKLRYAIGTVRASLNSYFSAGGFGAKGRAANIDTAIGFETSIADLQKYTIDPAFIQNIKLNDLTLSDRVKVGKVDYTPTVESVALIVGGTSYQKEQERAAVPKMQMNPNKNIGASFTKGIVSKDREEGQYAAMKNTNARGYAWVTGTPGWNSMDWEWLHIRGAGLGGATDSSNLVLGTRDSNTHMIPFEQNIKNMSAIAKRFGCTLMVNWDIGPINNKDHSHKVSSISVTWSFKSPKNAVLSNGSAVFDPLHSTSSISKLEVEYLQEMLKKEREKIAKNAESLLKPDSRVDSASSASAANQDSTMGPVVAPFLGDNLNLSLSASGLYAPGFSMGRKSKPGKSKKLRGGKNERV